MKRLILKLRLWWVGQKLDACIGDYEFASLEWSQHRQSLIKKEHILRANLSRLRTELARHTIAANDKEHYHG